MIKSRQQDGRH